jgi:hypothetical protein
MATQEQLKNITKARVQSFINLMKAEDWFWAAYTMAMALEYALKTMVCKTLDFSTYPQNPKKPRIVSFFWTHEFEQLLIISGLTQTIKSTQTPEIFQNWSDFTKEFPGNWPEIKYDYERQQQFDKVKVERLSKNLLGAKYGLITKIKEKW